MAAQSRLPRASRLLLIIAAAALFAVAAAHVDRSTAVDAGRGGGGGGGPGGWAPVRQLLQAGSTATRRLLSASSQAQWGWGPTNRWNNNHWGGWGGWVQRPIAPSIPPDSRFGDDGWW